MSYENDFCVTVVAHVPDPNFKLEAVVVYDHYHDFLRCTLPHNKFHFDKMVVVTSPEDRETQRVCQFYRVLTDALRSRRKQLCMTRL